MASKFFGAGGGASTGLAGAAGGFLTGGPLGAGLGLLGGLLGNGGEQKTTYDYSSLSPEQQALMSKSEGVLGQLLRGLAPGQQNELIASLTRELSGVARTGVEDTFSGYRASQGANEARSGGRLSSVSAVNSAALGRQETKALVEALLGARLGAEQIGAGRHAQNVAGVGATMGTITGLEGTRRMISQTGSGDPVGDSFGGAMSALSDPTSYFNTSSSMSGIGGGKWGGFMDQLMKG